MANTFPVVSHYRAGQIAVDGEHGYGNGGALCVILIFLYRLNTPLNVHSVVMCVPYLWNIVLSV